MKKPPDPAREEAREIKEPGYCPFCRGPLTPHKVQVGTFWDYCGSRRCKWVSCAACSAYGPETGMVLP